MTVREAEQRISTPTVRGGFRRALPWILVVIAGLVIALLTIGLSRGTQSADRLDPASAGPNGARALVEVLKQQGVDVRTADSLRSVNSLAGSADQETLVLIDNGIELETAGYRRLLQVADRIVLVSPGFAALQALAPGVDGAGSVDGTVDADCAVSAVRAAGTVSITGDSYRLAEGTDGEACLGSGDDRFSLIQLTDGSRQLTVLGTDRALANDTIGTNGNAALALNLLGQSENLIWYTPGFDDLDIEQPQSVTPNWYVPLVVLAIAIALAAALWRGRRFGPLVVERLPVVVPTSETMEGRSRLYQRASARLRALDSLRVGTVARLAVACGLPRTATIDEVVDAVAALLGRDRAPIRALLLEIEPTNDAHLVGLSDDLQVLELDAAAATLGR